MLGNTIPFFSHNYLWNLVKMQTPLDSYGIEYPNFILVLLSDNRSLRFSARRLRLARFFDFQHLEEKEYADQSQ